MLRDVLLASLVGLLLIVSGSGQSSNIHYAIVAPKAFRPSSVYNVSATCYNVPEDVTLFVRLRQSDQSSLIKTEVILKSGVTQIVSLLIPDDVPEYYYYLEVRGSGGYNIYHQQYVTVMRKTLSIFVQTDKALYKPGQTVLLRAICVYPDLKPYQDLIDIVIYDHVGNRIMQWLDQRNESGVISQSLQLSTQTPLGKWQIEVTALEMKLQKTFEVAEYVLPKFKVTVLLPSYYLVKLYRRDQQEDLLVTILAEYTYGQPVKGRANVVIQLSPSSSTKITKDVELVDGKADLSLTIEELVTLVPVYYYYWGYRPDPWYQFYYQTILVVASVNETVTGIILAGSATVPCSSEKYQLQFLQNSPNTYKPGLLYTAFLQLSQRDGKPPDSSDILLPGGGYRSVRVQVTTYYPMKCTRYGETQYVPPTTKYVDVTLTPSGYMILSLMIDADSINVNLQPTFYINATATTVYAYKYLQVFRTRDYQAIRVSYASPAGVIRPLETAEFEVKTTEPITTFHYEVLGKGIIQLSGNVVGNKSTEHSLSIWISYDLALDLAPYARVLVWLITASGEIIIDSTEVSVSDYFANQVSLSFDRNSTTPSLGVSLTVNAYQGSFIGLLAVDQSVLLLKGGNDISVKMVSDQLIQYDALNGYYTSDPWTRQYNLDGRDSLTILSNSGLFMLTDGYFYRYSYYVYYPDPETSTSEPPTSTMLMSTMGGTMEEAPTTPQMFPETSTGAPMPSQTPPPNQNNQNVKAPEPREDFPETWIWTDTVASSYGQVILNTSVPDTITSWIASAFAISQVAGLGVAANQAKLTVFKQFFLSPNLPYSVIRHEEFALKLTVFNYMSTKLDVTVTLKKSKHYKIQGNSSHVVQVESNDAVPIYFWIVTKSLGQVPIEISAVSPVAGDAIRVMLLVKPEGVQRQYSTSEFIQLSSSTQVYNKTLNVSLPPDGILVPDSQYIEITCIGDLMGTTIQGLDKLLQMPYGCGEQNMLNFAPDVYIVKYLSVSGQLTEDLKSKALRFMNAGYQTELTYQRSDGSFSAFGNGDLSGSVWLSALVINCFHEAKGFITVDDAKIARTMLWIIGNQAYTGSFAEPPNGRVIHVDMQGGSSKGLPLTAYVLNSLLENKDNSQIYSVSLSTSISKARNYLENQVANASADPYALSIVAYALVRSNSSKVSDVLQKLEALAIIEAGTRHWKKASDSSDDSYTGWIPPYQQDRSVNIEMTAYVLLTYCELKDYAMGLPIAKWLIEQRNAFGGFSSTQDTVIGLKALAAFASMILGPANESGLQVSIATVSVQHAFIPITQETSLLLQSYELPLDTTNVSVIALGIGSALIQLNVKYNVFETNDNSGIILNVNTTQNGNKLTVRICSSWEKEEGSGMVLIEFRVLTGFKATNEDDLKYQANGLIKRVETNDDEIVLYLDELKSSETCIDIILEKVFQVSKVKAAPVKVYPYYDPSGGRTVFYGAPESLGQNDACDECPECCSK